MNERHFILCQSCNLKCKLSLECMVEGQGILCSCHRWSCWKKCERQAPSSMQFMGVFGLWCVGQFCVRVGWKIVTSRLR